MKRLSGARRYISVVVALQLVFAVGVWPAVATAAAPPADAGPQPLLGGELTPLAIRHIVADDGAAADAFGFSVALFGNTAIIGARNENTGQGAAYVFARTGPTWVQQEKLVAEDGAAGDYFGYTVAINGETAIVGAWGDDPAGAHSGSAYVFTRSGAHWTQQQRISPDDGAAGDRFGLSVAIFGETALIGADADDVGGADSGSAYVFSRSGTTWTKQARLDADGGGAADHLGTSVALYGDTALVGAVGDDDKGADAGAAYVFGRSGTTWSQRQKLTDTDGAAADYYGFSVGLCADTAVIGAFGDDDRGAGAGSAYAYVRSGGTFALQQKLLATDGLAGDRFGHTVSVSGDAILVGAAYVDDSGTDAGAAYLYRRTGTTWGQMPKLYASAPGAGNLFGQSVAISGGIALVGSLGDDDKGTDSGSADVITFDPTPPSGLVRVAGADRYTTAIECSKRGFPMGAPAVVIATGANWPDALGGSALAGAVFGPILLTPTASLHAGVRAEILRLGAGKAYILGSAAAVSTAVENSLVAMLGRGNVVRLGGASRYETAAAIADEVYRLTPELWEARIAFVATGANFPDAAAVSPIASRMRAPIALVNPATGAVYLPPGTAVAEILGGPSAVSTSVEAALDAIPGLTVDRIAGADRYATADAIAVIGVGLGFSVNKGGVATGENFPDALTAGPMLGAYGSVLLLTPSKSLAPVSRARLVYFEPLMTGYFVIGGTGAVSAGVAAEVKAAAGL